MKCYDKLETLKQINKFTNGYCCFIPVGLPRVGVQHATTKRSFTRARIIKLLWLPLQPQWREALGKETGEAGILDLSSLLVGVWGCRLSPLLQAEVRKGFAWVKCALLQSYTEVSVAPGDKSPQQLCAFHPQPRSPFLFCPPHRKPSSAPTNQLLCFPYCIT